MLIVKGLKAVVVSDCWGYRLIANVTLAFPCKSLKSGINLLTAKNTSPMVPCVCISKSYDFTNEVTVVVVPSGLTWSVPTSCSNKTVWPKPDSPTIIGKLPDALSLNFVAIGLG